MKEMSGRWGWRSRLIRPNYARRIEKVGVQEQQRSLSLGRTPAEEEE